jgi:hypothetical protein
MMQAHYGQIFAEPDAASDHVVAALNTVMKADPHYAHYLS